MGDEDFDTGGTPDIIVGCTACENTYPAQRTPDDGFRPIGTDGFCACGNDDFEPVENRD